MFRENQQIGYYTLVKFLGRGGFGEVWLAEKRNVFPPEQVAIKLPQDAQIDLQTVKNEIFNWILSGKHKNILPIIECETFGDQIAIVSEYAPDGSLKDLIERTGRLAVADAIEVITGVLEGLAHLHNRRIIHRDLKPENILLQGRIPRLTDFGISRALTDVHNSSSTVIGTQAYMAPEAFDGKRTLQTDIWSVGVIFYLLLSGRLPFPQKEMTELIGAIVMHEPAPLPEYVPPPVRNIVEKALSKNIASRYQTADEMLGELAKISPSLTTAENFVQGSMATQMLPVANTPVQRNAATEVITVPQKRRSKTGIIVLSVFVVLFSLIGAAVYGMFKLVQNRQQNRIVSTTQNGQKPVGNSNKLIDLESDSDEENQPLNIKNISPAQIDEIFNAVEKEYGGKIKVTVLRIFTDKGNVTHANLTAQDLKNSEYYDSYGYSFRDKSVSKRPLKNPAFFEKTGGKFFYKEEVNWNAIAQIAKAAEEKAKEIGESADGLSIDVTRKFIRFSPDTYGDIIIEADISGSRKDLSLTADAKGENVKVEVK